MQVACGETEKKIIIDEETARMAQYKLSIQYYKSVKVKGKD